MSQKNRYAFWELGNAGFWHLYRPLPKRDPKLLGGARYVCACDSQFRLVYPGRGAKLVPPAEQACGACRSAS